MAIDPNIALGYKPIQLEQRNPFQEYAQIAQIQNAQNQNALAQYQLGAAQRTEKSQNMLADAYAQSTNPSTGKIDYNKLTGLLAAGGGGAQLPGIEKTRRETETATLAQQKAVVELGDAKLKQSRQFLNTIDPTDPNAPAEYIAWHEANHRDPIIGPMLEARGVTADQSRQRIENAIAKGPADFARLLNESKLGTEEFMRMNKPVTNVGPTGIVQTPGLGGAATVVPGTEAAFQMTPAQIAANKIAQQRANYEGQRVGLEGQRAAIAQQELDRKVAGGELKPVPVHAQKAITGAAASIGQLSDAIDLLKGLEVSGQKGSKSATGLKAYAPDIALNRLDPAGTVTRAAIADIGSMIMHDRSGAAVTVSESPRLKPFIPLTTDDAATALKKLERLRKIQLDDSEALTSTYNPEQGFKSFKAPIRSGAGKPAAPTIAPPSGFTPD